MCRLYGFRSSDPTRVECTLVHSQNALMVQSRTDTSGKSHGHGWGIAVYEDTFPLVSREAWDAYQNEAFRDAAARIYSRAVIAHVRRATVGPALMENTHPFVEGLWAFAHNGTIPNFDAVRPLMLDQISERHRGAIRGDTDSEVMFRLFLSRLDEEGMTPESALAAAAIQVVEWCREVDPAARIGLNVLASDGRTLVGLRWGRSLHFVERSGVTDCEICRYAHVRAARSDGYRALVVASEPLTHTEVWSEVPEGSVVTVDDGYRLSFHPLGPQPEESRPAAVPAAAEPLRTTLVEEFMMDHRALAAGIEVLIDAIEDGCIEESQELADRIDRVSGSHIAFEEHDLYPAIGAEPSMYQDHEQGRTVIASALSGFPPSRSAELVADAQAMLEHMEDCGVLLGRVRTLTAIEQSRLEDRLLAWRVRAPRWMELARAGRT